MPVAEMLRRMSGAELTEWAAYEKVNGPLGPTRDDVLTAQLSQMIHRAMGSLSSKSPPNKPLHDYVIQWDRPPQSPADMLRTVQSLHRKMGGE